MLGGIDMIEEQFVSFDTAKLLKEAGFDEVCSWAYYRAYNWCLIHERNSKLCLGYYSRPTQALAARWLREAHHYAVCVWYSAEDEKWFYAYGNLDNMMFNEEYSISDLIYDSYEQALEAGISFTLKNLISNE